MQYIFLVDAFIPALYASLSAPTILKSERGYNLIAKNSAYFNICLIIESKMLRKWHTFDNKQRWRDHICDDIRGDTLVSALILLREPDYR